MAIKSSGFRHATLEVCRHLNVDNIIVVILQVWCLEEMKLGKEILMRTHQKTDDLRMRSLKRVKTPIISRF